MNPLASCVLAVILFAPFAAAAEDAPPQAPQASALIDPRIGTLGGGNTVVGPARPFGLVKLGPDMVGPDLNSGYDPARPLLGFSHLHVSGTGGGPKYGNILVTPTTGPLALTAYESPSSEEEVKLGYYATTLERYGVRAELTTTRRVGLHRYTFAKAGPAHVLFNVDHILTSSAKGESQRFEGGEVRIVSPTELRGTGRYSGGWNKGREYRVHFCAQLDTATEGSGTWTNGVPLPISTTNRSGLDGALGAYVDLKVGVGQVVQLKVGVSFISPEQACGSIQTEAPGWDFDAVRAQTVQAWDEALANISIEGGLREERVSFYTALYHALLMPTDRTDENPRWTSAEPSYDDFYAIWDTYRTTSPLLTLIAPERQAAIVRSMIDIYRHDGYLPDGRSGNDNGRTQGGSHGQIVLADAYLKGLPGIDWQTGFEAMAKDSETPPLDAQKEGRGGLADYNTKGYISLAFERSLSRTVEYSHDDWAVAQVAKRLFKLTDYVRYRNRAKSWENLWDESVEAEGVKGFLRPRLPDGSWLTPFDLAASGSWADYAYESDAWEYSLYVPHDVRRLIERCGGPGREDAGRGERADRGPGRDRPQPRDGREAFVKRLDTLFESGHFRISNEPAFHIPTLYIWAGRHDKTAARVRQILRESFHPRPDGLPGNDDSGATSAWFAFNALGLYPNPGHDYYLITSPLFGKTTLRVGKDKAFVIEAHGLDAEGRNAYVKKATLNGKSLDRAWLRHSEIQSGATLVLEMSPTPDSWPGSKAVPPPSLSDDEPRGPGPGSRPEPPPEGKR